MRPVLRWAESFASALLDLFGLSHVLEVTSASSACNDVSCLVIYNRRTVDWGDFVVNLGCLFEHSPLPVGCGSKVRKV